MQKVTTVALLLSVVLLLLGFAGVSQALTLYDDFNTKPINPAKWSGSEGNFGLSAPNTETARKIAGGKLKISATTWGGTDSNIGTLTAKGSRLNVTNPAPITTFQADVTVKGVTVVGCAANTTRSFSLDQVEGGYFNDGTSSGPGDRTGDIIAVIQKTRDNISGDRIEAVIFRCTNPTCTGEEILTFGFFGISWVKGVADALRLQWEQVNHRFVFTVNPDGLNPETLVLNYTVSDSNPPVVVFRQLSVGNKPANCMLPEPRTMTLMNALFDNVMVNP